MRVGVRPAAAALPTYEGTSAEALIHLHSRGRDVLHVKWKMFTVLGYFEDTLCSFKISLWPGLLPSMVSGTNPCMVQLTSLVLEVPFAIPLPTARSLAFQRKAASSHSQLQQQKVRLKY